MKLHFPYLRTLLYLGATVLSLVSSASYAKETRHFFKPDTAMVSGLSNYQLAAVAARAHRELHTTIDANDKAITNVKVFYNPVAEQIAVSFKLSKLNHVSIRVMDALGNEVMGLMSGELDGGIQSLSFETNSKLAAGFYFVRVTSGSETVIKRISIR